MHIFLIIVASLFATTTMTLFSYLMSEKLQNLFKEPILLKMIIEKLHLSTHHEAVLGWLSHYAIGVLFVIVYDITWNTTYLDPTWYTGLIFGIISGIVGVGGWIVIFSLPEKAPRIDYRRYYIQLFFAHIIFALTAVGVYKLWIYTFELPYF